MSRYKLRIIDEGRYSLETITEIVDLNKPMILKDGVLDKWKRGVLGPIYTTGLFEMTDTDTPQKKVPKILQSKAFEKVLSLIIDNKVRYIEMIIEGWNIKFHTRNPEYNMYEYNLNLSENRPVIIPT